MDISKYKNVGMLNVPAYSKQFINKQTDILDSTYAFEATDEDFERVASLGGDEYDIDTAEEIALLSATAGVINVRPVEAAEMLPANDPVLMDLQLGAMLYMKKAAVSFLGGGDPAKYAVELKFITGRGNVSEADIKKFMAQGIAAAVDAEFNKVIFKVNTDTDGANVELIRKPNEYILVCDGYWGNPKEKEVKRFSASSMDALITVMRNSGSFSTTAFNIVRAQAANIPAVFLEKTGKDPRADMTAIITTFYLSPTNQTVYGAMRDVNVFYDVMRHISRDSTEATMYRMTQNAYRNAIAVLCLELSERVADDSRGRTSITLASDVVGRLQLVSLQQ
ncbi:hypothetical protein NO2_0852 [Candidatus Termititenax persephonae]|uniref:Uncharacterized protein n=1 Tax=Candidatus Termititenax persephonae TaxID=2218525 RepID=A0A388THR6_9BACT|nr:hypothetical protein NO2_0852 [Candidatus Termititenax persephonae]